MSLVCVCSAQVSMNSNENSLALRFNSILKVIWNYVQRESIRITFTVVIFALGHLMSLAPWDSDAYAIRTLAHVTCTLRD